MPTTELTDEDFAEEGTIDLITMLIKAGLVPTRSEGRRAIEQGGVSIDGEKITDIKHTVSKDTLTGDGVVLSEAKRNLTEFMPNNKYLYTFILGGKNHEEIRSKRTSSDVP